MQTGTICVAPPFWERTVRTLCTLFIESNMPKSIQKQSRDHKIALETGLKIVKLRKLAIRLLKEGKKSSREIAQITNFGTTALFRINNCLRNNDEAALSDHLNPSTDMTWSINRADYRRRQHNFRAPHIHGETRVCCRLGHSKINNDSDCIGRTPDQEKRR